MIYDKTNNRYYRIVLHKLKKYKEDGSVVDFRERGWSVIIIDQNFNKISEVLMPDNKFWKRIVATKQGIILKLISGDNNNEYQVYKCLL